MQEVRLRPAPARSERCYKIGRGRIVCHLADDILWDISLSQISDISFVSWKARDRLLWRIELTTPEQTVDISANLPTQGTVVSDDYLSFQKIVAVLTTALLEHQSEMQITLGERGFAQKALFAFGVLSTLAGTGLLIGAAVSGLSISRLIAAATPMCLLLLFGVLLLRNYHPWRHPVVIPLSKLSEVLRALAGDRQNRPQSGG